MKRPDIKNHFGKHAKLNDVTNSYKKCPELFSYAKALDQYIDWLMEEHCTCEFPIIRTMEKRSIAGTAKRILI